MCCLLLEGDGFLMSSVVCKEPGLSLYIPLSIWVLIVFLLCHVCVLYVVCVVGVICCECVV